LAQANAVQIRFPVQATVTLPTKRADGNIIPVCSKAQRPVTESKA
jgi:hypothetical protein